MKKYFILLLSLMLTACSSYETLTGEESREPVYAFFFSSDKENLYLLGDKEDYWFTGGTLTKLAAFLDSVYAERVVKVAPSVLFDTDKQMMTGYYEVFVRDDGLTAAQKNALKQGKYGAYQAVSSAERRALQTEYHLAAQVNIYRTEYRAYGKPVKLKNRDTLLADYKLAQPLNVRFIRTHYSGETEIESHNLAGYTLGVLTAPVWIPLVFTACLQEQRGFMDFCPF